MPVQILTIARNAFVESIRQPIYFVLVMTAVFLQVMSTWTTAFSMGYSDSAEVSGDNKLLLDFGLGTVFVFGMLLSAFMATAVVSREIERKTVLTVVSKPIARPSVVLGKFVGVAGAIVLAVVVMLAALLLGIRHGVMSTAADDLDGPVLLFGLSAVALSIGLGVWGNFMYGWYFSQTAMLTLGPLAVVSYVLVLFVGKHWQWQPPGTDLKPQIMIACAALTMAVLVLTAAATAVSTRVGQVMTIVICGGVFLLGLLSNYLFGTRAFVNRPIGVVQAATPVTAEDEGFDSKGATYTIELDAMPRDEIKAGDEFRFGPSPGGFPMNSPAFVPFSGDPARDADLFGPDSPPALIISRAEGRKLTVRNIGREPVPMPRPPQAGDFVFNHATKVRPVYLALWGLVPNLQHFWLLDAVTQNRVVPGRHLALLGAYSATQIGAFLALGVTLFQKRDVG
jgi:ABC-2 type transport system permease protein